MDRVCFFGLAVQNRVYNLTCLCPKQVKVFMKEKIIVPYLKGFSK